jgi:hypothetical protein
MVDLGPCAEKKKKYVQITLALKGGTSLEA